MAKRDKLKPRKDLQSPLDKVMSQLERFPDLYVRYREHLERSQGRVRRLDRYLSSALRHR